jgi:hypothetical protein
MLSADNNTITEIDRKKKKKNKSPLYNDMENRWHDDDAQYWNKYNCIAAEDVSFFISSV